jgi:hypothetical protein
MEFKVGDLLIEESNRVIEFRVGDLLIEESNWKPRMGICMERVPSREECFLVSVLVRGEVILSRPQYWKVESRAEEE